MFLQQKWKYYSQFNLVDLLTLCFLMTFQCYSEVILIMGRVLVAGRLQQFYMRNNFDINIPSIPSKAIKFKIQDIKTTVFGSQKNRFNQNKTFLTKKFIQSFNNFSEKSVEVEEETEAQSKEAQSRIANQQDYRFFIPEQKKYMLYHLDKYKNYKAPILKQTKYDRGYSFYRTDVTLPRGPQRRTHDYSVQEKAVSDCYFFPSTKTKHQEQLKESEEAKNKTAKPMSVFKNETRKRAYVHQQKQMNKLGPGQYHKDPQIQPKKPKAKSQKIKNKDVDYKRLKKIITNIVVNEEPLPQNEQTIDKEKEVKPNYMFREDDRDRFGQQKYPIAGRVQVPGPGAYDNKNSIEEHAHKITVVEEQRKLLKEWFNN